LRDEPLRDEPLRDEPLRDEPLRDEPLRDEPSRNELSGTVFGPSVQAGSIRDVHFHGESDTPRIPRQLLVAPAHFINRGDELVALDRLRDQGSGLVVLTGTGGVGKTALAMHWAHRVRERFPDGQLHLDLGGTDGVEPVHPAEALGSFLRALGVPAPRVPVALGEQAALYRSVTAGRRLLVVLENAYSAAQVRILLPASEASMVLVTSRSRLVGLLADGAHLIEVQPLSADDSVSLLARLVGPARIERERDRARELVAMCGGLPIALTVAAARLVGRPALSVRRVATDLTDETRRIAVLSAPDGPSVRGAFDMTYRFLDDSSAKLYRRLGLHPGPEFGPGPVAALMPAIRAASAEEHRPDGVEPLLDANLMREVAEERFRFHDLLRLHALQKAAAEDPPAVRNAAVRAMVEWYLAAARQADAILTPYRPRPPYAYPADPPGLPSFLGREPALAWLERERTNLVAAGRAAMEHGYAELAWHLCDVLWPLFLYHKHYRDRMEVDRRGVDAAREWGSGWAEADMLKRLARVSTTAGEYEAAERHIRAAIQRFREADDARGGIDAQEVLASLYQDTGRTSDAVGLFTATLAANRARGEDRSTGLTLISLGMLLPGLGRCTEALDHLEEAGRLFARLSAVDPYNEGRVSIGLGHAYLRVGDLSAAERAAGRAAERMRELGSAHERAEALDLLGRIAGQRGDVRSARERYRQALDIFDSLGSSRAAQVRGRIADLPEVPDPATG
jgi:tetratricopeptide (TPR) repeat protein